MVGVDGRPVVPHEAGGVVTVAIDSVHLVEVRYMLVCTDPERSGGFSNVDVIFGFWISFTFLTGGYVEDALTGAVLSAASVC